MRSMSRTITALVLLLPALSTLGAQELQTLQFRITDTEFLNPERGFYRYRNLTSPSNFAEVRDQGQTLIYGRVDASDFRSKPLSNAFLENIQAGFDEARTQGLKVKFRLAYNNGFDPDAPKDVILGHIQQLKPLWEKNSDVMFHMDAGFIGAWGEWHSSTNGLDNKTDRKEILFAILDALPKDRTVGIRTPHFKREIFNGSQLSNRDVITEETAFDESNISRVGHLNDCFLSSESDQGTYVLLNNNWPLERELDYIGGESRFVAFGGETCGLHDRSKTENAVAEMAQMHIDYLNLDYHPDVIQRWKDEGSFDEIQRRLGYRFELKSAQLPSEIRPGGLMQFKFTIDNVGFGELFNPRPVEVTLSNETGTSHTARLGIDPRRWTGGETNTVDTWLVLPDTLPVGNYSIGLWLPDTDASLRNDPRYAVRFANEDVWNAANGINLLTDKFVVSDKAKGIVYSASEFSEVADPSKLNLRGDFNGNGSLDTDDLDLLTGALSPEPTFDLNRDLVVDQLDRTYWLEELKQTRYGDADLNGQVEFADFLQLSNAFGSDGSWATGDFDGDGRVAFADFLLLSANYGIGNAEAKTLAEGKSLSVPEPNSITTFVWLLSVVARRRQKRTARKTPAH